jgi:hypothetical protein
LIFAVLLAAALARPQFPNQFGNQFGGFQQPGLGAFPGFGGKSLYCSSLLECQRTKRNRFWVLKKVLEAVLELELVTLDPEEFLHQA